MTGAVTRLTGAVLGVALALAAAPAVAAGLCPGARETLAASPALAEATAAALGAGATTEGSGEDCLSPVKRLDYRDRTVLIVTRGDPGAACHGCSASLTAHVLVRSGEGLTLLGSFPDFAESGSLGDPGTITATAIAGDDGFAVEGGGTFQGYTYAVAQFFAFRDTRLVAFQASPLVCTVVSDDGAVAEESEATTYDTQWRVDGDTLVLDGTIREQGAIRPVRTEWRFEGEQLLHKSGELPESATGDACL